MPGVKAMNPHPPIAFGDGSLPLLQAGEGL
jgi:hypothetical protein